MKYRVIGYLAVILFSHWTAAGILDMPEITETPELKRESMLRDMDIPSVRERDPDPEAGPRLAVKKFRLQGIVEYPELGITRAEIENLVEALRFDMMQEGKLLDSGYTLDELAEVSNLLAEIEEQTKGQHVSPLEVQRLVFLVREQRRKRGMTLGMIETVADSITRYYRERGFILAKAYISKQQVRDGIVTLTLLLGVLGEVEVNNNTHYRDSTVQSVFASLMAKPVTSQVVEEKLFFVNDLPGLSAQGYFEAGSQVGDTKLNINVSAEEYFDFNIRGDNHGAQQTGENRLYADFTWNNPIGIGDQFYLGILNSSNPSNTTYGALRYSTQLLSPRLKVSFGVSNNTFVLGPGNSESINLLALEGESNVTDISFSYILKRSRKKNYSIDLVGEQIESLLRLGAVKDFGDIGLDDEIRNISLVFNYDILQEQGRLLHQGTVKLTSGEFLLGAQEEEGQDERFAILSTNYTLLTFWQIPFFDAESRIIVRASTQYSGKSLSSISQFSLAGPTRARGYSVNQFFADDAVYTGVDWIFSAPDFLNFSIGTELFNDMVQPFMFFDYSYGIAHALRDEDEDTTGQLLDLGLGLKFSYKDNFRANLQLGFPVNSDISSDTNNIEDDSANLYFDFQYSF